MNDGVAVMILITLSLSSFMSGFLISDSLDRDLIIKSKIIYIKDVGYRCEQVEGK